MTEIELFVSEYGEAGHGRVAFAWNGKHAMEFVDANQTFRTAVVKYVCENPGRASTGLLSDLLRAESQWAREAWGAPHSYAELAALVLGRGGSDALEAFLDCYAMSFDTFGASHQMRIDVVSLASLCDEVKRRIPNAKDPATRQRLEGARDLFEKLRNSTSHVGWAVVAPWTPVANVHVVSKPELVLRRVFGKIRRFFLGTQ